MGNNESEEGETRNRQEYSSAAQMELVSKNASDDSLAIMSTMKVEVRLTFENLPPFPGKTETQKYVLSCKIVGNSIQPPIKLAKKVLNNSLPKHCKPFVLGYEMGADQIYNMSVYRWESSRQYKAMQFPQLYGRLEFDLNEAIVSADRTMKKQLMVQNEDSSDVWVVLQVAEKKQINRTNLSFVLQLQNSKFKGPLYFLCFRLEGEAWKFCGQSENEYATKQAPGLFNFERVSMESFGFEKPWEEQTLQIQFFTGTPAKGVSPTAKKAASNPVAISIVPVRKLLDEGLARLPLNSKSPGFGRIMIKQRSLEHILTLGSMLFSNLRIAPVIAVDFSLANLTFDAIKCMHHHDKARPNYYEQALHQIIFKLSPFYSTILAYGFGAKLIAQKGKHSNCFALNGSIFDPSFRTREELLAVYTQALKEVELFLPVKYSEMIKLAKGLAQCELERYIARYKALIQGGTSPTAASMEALHQYYVLYLVAAGVLDDAEDTFAECEGVAELPLSIILVKIGNQQMRDVNDILELQNKIDATYSPKRRFMTIIEFDKVYNDLPHFGKFFSSTIPAQVLQFVKLIHQSPVSPLPASFSGTARTLDHVETAVSLLRTEAKEEPLSGRTRSADVNFDHCSRSSSGSGASLGQCSGGIKAPVVQVKEEEKGGDAREAYSSKLFFQQLKTMYMKTMQQKGYSMEDINRAIATGVPDLDCDPSLCVPKKQ